MIRIALVTPMLPVPHDQTRGRYIHETAKALSRLAIVKVFFQQSRYPKFPLISPRSFLDGHVGADYQIEGLDVEAFTYPVFPLISRSINGHVSSSRLIPRVADFQPDVLLAYWVYPDGFAALRAARKLGVPCVVGALGSDILVRSGVTEQMTRQTIAGVDALLTVSEAMRQTAISEFGAPANRVHTIVNGFNTSVFYPRDQGSIRSRLGIPLDEQLIIYVGRFVEAKGMRELIEAFSAMAQRNAKLSLALIGDGVMKAELVSLVEAAGLQGRVRIPGGQAPEQVAEWICAANVLTLPSWSEGYPNVVVEGLACGRPVVATDVGGTREILNSSNGILIKPKNVEFLREALEQALVHNWDNVAIADSMRRTWDDVANETLHVCQELTERRARDVLNP
jgi:teichuronic acid biosynthesis glycosyltransferase TuaC